MMADDGYEKLCRIKSLLAECMVPPRESKFLNLDRYLEDENGVTFIPDPPQWCNISFRGFQERVLTFRPQYWGADPNATLWFSKYGWQCVEKFVIKCDICSSTVECSSLIQKPDLWGDIAHKAHDRLCYWSFCPCPDRFIQIITHPKILCKNVSSNWKKIMVYGIELPKIDNVLLDKMGFTRKILEHLFKIIESNSSEEGVSALVLVICGWLKSSEDKILECAYCQRHLALRHFISIQDGLEVIADQEQISSEMRDTDSEMDTSETNSEFVSTSQQRKPVRKCSPAIHRATANHLAHPRVGVTKQNFPSYCNLMLIRYGLVLGTNLRISQKKKKLRGRQHEEEENSGNKTTIIENDIQDPESTQKVCDTEMKTLERNSSNMEDVASKNNLNGDTVINGQKQLLCEDNVIKSNKDTDNLNVVQEEAAAKMKTDGSSKLVEEDLVTKVKHDTKGIESSESEKTCVDTEMADLSTSHTNTENKAADGRLGTSNENSKMQQSGTKVGEEDTVADCNVSEPSIICLSESRSSAEIDQSVEENSFERQDKEGKYVDKPVVSTTSLNKEMEMDNTVIPSSDEKLCMQTGKRELKSDDKTLEEPPSKKIKDSVESPQQEKKNLNPVNEHRFWCIWRIKTVDRLMGSTKEGWKQILDLLKFGVSPQPSELDEQEAVDLFEEVKKIHYMMTDW